VTDATPPPSTTPWTQLQALRAEGVARADWVSRLVSAGLTPEDARVLVNSLDGPTPSALPEPSFAPGINPFATALPFTELGLEGAPVTVGLYWVAFGAAVFFMLGLFALLVSLDIARLPEDALRLIAWVMGSIGAGAIGWGALRVLGRVRVRRRSSR
jgi:hypothetical protein